MSSSEIKCLKNGPLLVEGDFTLTDPNGRTYGLAGRTRVALCRCGASQNKPFCDGAHNKMAFDSDPEAKDLPPQG